MGEILFLAHRIPFPPDRGDKIRSHHVLKRLAQLAPVHVATFADDEADWAHEAELARVASSYRLVRREKPLALAGLQALASGEPVSLAAFHSRVLAEYVGEVLASRPISAIFGYSVQMGQYVPDDFAGRFVFDFVDVDSAKFEAYARTGNPLMRGIHAREARLLAAEEARIARRAVASLLVSPEEAALFAGRAGDGARVIAMGNGIDTQIFDPFRVSPEPRLAGIEGPRLIFTGQMDYPPNVEAVVRAVRRLMPRIRAVLPGAGLHIVGRQPTAQVRALDGVDGVRVWGRVDDIAPWLAAADLALVPLEIARGVQNKVLEAMAMALPVVCSRGAATGIGAQDGRDFLVGDDDDALVRGAIALLRDRRKARTMGLSARHFLEQNRSWDAVLDPLAGLAGFGGDGVSDVA